MEFGGEVDGEVVEVFEDGVDVDFCFFVVGVGGFVEEDGEEGLGFVGVGDCLGGEEEFVFGDGVVECFVEGFVVGGVVRGVGWVFEEEDDVVDGVEFG